MTKQFVTLTLGITIFVMKSVITQPASHCDCDPQVDREDVEVKRRCVKSLQQVWIQCWSDLRSWLVQNLRGDFVILMLKYGALSTS